MELPDEFVTLRIIVQGQPILDFCREFGMERNDVVAQLERYRKKIMSDA